MGEVATIEVERVFPGRKAGNGEVYDVRTADGKKFAAWGSVGAAMFENRSGTFTVEYELRPKNGYDNATILKIVGSNGTTGSVKSAATPNPFDSKGAQINRSVAFKGAVDLVVAFGSADSPFDALAQVGALTEDALLIVDASFVAESFSLADTE